jgi:hypothetical protein
VVPTPWSRRPADPAWPTHPVMQNVTFRALSVWFAANHTTIVENAATVVRAG